MKVYNIEKDIIEDLVFVIKNGSTYFIQNVDEETLNSIGYLNIDNSNYEQNTIFEYYKQVLSVYGNKCVIKYYKHDRDIDEIKFDMLLTVSDSNTIDLINNCITVDELRNI